MIGSFQRGPEEVPRASGELDEIVSLARAAASAAGSYARAQWSAQVAVASTKSSYRDVVTAVDQATERLIVAMIAAARPGDGVVAEEGNDRPSRTGVRWYVDPIDGTVNYLYGLPQWATSIAVTIDGLPYIGVVEIPMQDEMFVAVRGRGASRVSGPVTDILHVNDPISLPDALIGTGFGYDTERRRYQGEQVRQVIPLVRDIRRGGSCAIDLCSVAAGRLDGYFEIGPQPWDYAAGGLIAVEAGAALEFVSIAGQADPLVVTAGSALFPGLRAAVV